LDAIKDANVAHCCRMLEERGVEYVQRKILYPKIDYGASFEALRDFADAKGDMIDLYVDISCFPRMMIFNLLDHLMSHRQNEAAGDLNTRKLRFFYSEPISYPSTVNIETLGDIYCVFGRRAFHSEAQKYRLIDNVIFLNGNSHDVMQTRAIALSDVRSADVNNHYFIYVNKDHFGFSYQKLWQNVGALKEIRDTGERVRVVFDIEDMTMQLVDTVNSIIERQSGIKESAVFFGCYGPKILRLSCYLAMRYYQRESKEIAEKEVDLGEGKKAGLQKAVMADLLTPRDSQYTSIYSHGLKSTKLYEFYDVRREERPIKW